MRWGKRNRRSTAVAAEASGGATMAPSVIAAAQPIAGTNEWCDERDRGNGARRPRQRRGCDGREVVAQVARRGIEGRVEQGRRDEQGQRKLGIERDFGHTGNRASAAPASASSAG